MSPTRSLRLLLVLIPVISTATLHTEETKESPRQKIRIDPRSLGAKADGITFDTEALQRAIDACGEKGGTVLLTVGTYLTKPLELHGHMTLRLEKGAVLLGSPDIADYPVRLPSRDSANGCPSSLCRSLLFATNADGLTLEGEGRIDGNCLKMNIDGYVRRCNNEQQRPSLIRFFNSRDVTVRGITLAHPCMWTQIYSACDNLLLDHVTVDAPPDCYNLDGIDICDCHDVVIRGCDVRAEDDAVCLKSMSSRGLSNILVENNRILSYRANAIKLGSASAGPVSHVDIRHNSVEYAILAGLNIASVDGSVIRDFHVRDLEISRTSQPLYIRLGNRGIDSALAGGKHPPGSIDGIVIERLHARNTHSHSSWPSCSITGIPGARIRNVTVRDSSFEMPGGIASIPTTPPEKEHAYPQSNMFRDTPGYAFFIRHADGILLDHVSVSSVAPDARPWISVIDAEVKCLDCTVDGKPAGLPDPVPVATPSGN